MFSKQTRSELFYLPFCSFLWLSNPVYASDYASCLAEKLQGINHEAAVKAITEACRAQYPNRTAATPVRDLIDGRYRDNGNGTITDIRTNLIWLRCSVGQKWTGETCQGNAKSFNWDNAMKLARDGWRLPTVEELDTLVKCPAGRKPSERPKGSPFVTDTNGACHGNEYNNPKININVFPNTPSDWFWSSSPVAGFSGAVWGVYFGGGHVEASNDGSSYLVRLVRAQP